ncbi:hypothetical protein B1J93_17760 [Leptospira kirschneri serovar Pomona]|uniref:Uncharacterized protein n=1 Tax=Leptospira kirschneri serovar Pomona TaxID=561005 RepID=A0A1T1DH61_9LEPT|nr:hypothetical protein [Leptospira kirschneri]OOV40194.1 hypothetical protein B1J93_17760 [Leptospira kirschneri serovar Pomona]
MTLDLKAARKMISHLATSTSADSSYRVEFAHTKSEMTFSIKKLLIPGNLPPGVYRAQVFEITEEGEKPLSNFEFCISPKGESEQSPVAFTPQTPVEIQAPKDLNLSILLELRKQDQLAHENERQIWETKLDSLRLLYESENKRKDESHKSEIDRINKDWEYKLEMTKNNQILLESERVKMTKAIESRIRGELKTGNSEGMGLEKVLDNPLLQSIIGKAIGISLPASGSGEGIDMAQIMQLAQGFLKQTNSPGMSSGNIIKDILNRGV